MGVDKASILNKFDNAYKRALVKELREEVAEKRKNQKGRAKDEQLDLWHAMEIQSDLLEGETKTIQTTAHLTQVESEMLDKVELSLNQGRLNEAADFLNGYLEHCYDGKGGEIPECTTMWKIKYFAEMIDDDFTSRSEALAKRLISGVTSKFYGNRVTRKNTAKIDDETLGVKYKQLQKLNTIAEDYLYYTGNDLDGLLCEMENYVDKLGSKVYVDL